MKKLIFVLFLMMAPALFAQQKLTTGVPIFNRPGTMAILIGPKGLNGKCNDPALNTKNCDVLISAVRQYMTTEKVKFDFTSSAYGLETFIKEVLKEIDCPRGITSVPGIQPDGKTPAVIRRHFSGSEKCLSMGGRPIIPLAPGQSPAQVQEVIKATLKDTAATAKAASPPAPLPKQTVAEKPPVVEVKKETTPASRPAQPVVTAPVQRQPVVAPTQNRASTVATNRPAPVVDASFVGLPFAEYSLSRTKADLIALVRQCNVLRIRPRGMHATCEQLVLSFHRLGLAPRVNSMPTLVRYLESLEEVACPATMDLIGLNSRREVDWSGVTRAAHDGERCLREPTTKRFVVSLYCVNPTTTPAVIPDAPPPQVVAQAKRDTLTVLVTPDSVVAKKSLDVSTGAFTIHDSLRVLFPDSSLIRILNRGIVRTPPKVTLDSAKLLFTDSVRLVRGFDNLKLTKDTTIKVGATVLIFDSEMSRKKRNWTKWAWLGGGFLAGTATGIILCKNNLVPWCPEVNVIKRGGPVNPPNNLFDDLFFSFRY